MNRDTPGGGVQVGLAYVGLNRSITTVLEHLAFARIRATFFVPPHQLVSEAVRWRRVIEAGHELGNSALLGVTDDGRLRNWNFEAIEGDLREGDRLLRELGMATVDSIFLPGHFHVCSQGSYRAQVQRRYSVCVSDSQHASSVRGCTGQFHMQGPGVRTRITAATVVVVQGELDPSSDSRMLVRLAKYQTGPVSKLAKLP